MGSSSCHSALAAGLDPAQPRAALERSGGRPAVGPRDPRLPHPLNHNKKKPFGCGELTLTGAPLSQVEGCGRDLAEEKDYYRRYKVCQAHASDPCVVVRGAQQRFCQQCGTFHAVSEFDLDKRCAPASLQCSRGQGLPD